MNEAAGSWFWFGSVQAIEITWAEAADGRPPSNSNSHIQ